MVRTIRATLSCQFGSRNIAHPKFGMQFGEPAEGDLHSFLATTEVLLFFSENEVLR